MNSSSSSKTKLSNDLRSTLRNELKMGGGGKGSDNKNRSFKSSSTTTKRASSVVTFELMDRWSSSASQLSFSNLTDELYGGGNSEDDDSCKNNFQWGFNSAPDLAYNHNDDEVDYSFKSQDPITTTTTNEEMRVDSCPMRPGRRLSLLTSSVMPGDNCCDNEIPSTTTTVVDSCPIRPGRRSSLLGSTTFPPTKGNDDDSEKKISKSNNSKAMDVSLACETLRSCMSNKQVVIQRIKRVSFLARDSIVTSIPYTSLDDYTDEELEACWYSKQDLVEVEATNIQLVKRMKKGKRPLDGHSFRGLEDYRDETTVATALSSTNVSSTSSPRHNEIMMMLCHRHNQLHRDAVTVVLDYVAKACKNGNHQFNDEVLSALYRNASQKHKLLALTAGWKDEREAKNIYDDDDDASVDIVDERTEVADATTTTTTAAPASPNKTLHVGNTNTVLIGNNQERQETKRWTHVVTTPAA